MLQYFGKASASKAQYSGEIHSPADTMGLTLYYELRLPASTSRDTALAKLRELHAFAATLPFEGVSALLLDDGKHSIAHSDTAPHPDTKADHARRTLLRYFAPIVAHPFDADESTPLGNPDSAMGFFVSPGEWSETASFFLMRRLDATGANAEWFWYCCCKTQYASNVSEAHFVNCHTLLVKVLDYAITCGIEVVVEDEGHYWETRDEALLLTHVQKMNTLLAAFAGQLSDEFDDPDSVQAPIFDPRFERLEMGEQ